MPGDTLTYTLQAGDVVQLVGQWAAFEPEPHGDLSGSLLSSNKPVQVIAFNALLNGVPTATDGNPDHIEETVPLAEVIGKSYVVAAPTGPDGRVPEPVGTSDWTLVREQLGEGQDGAHRLEATAKVGLQVMGFGSATSYSYPGGLDLKPISDRPVIVK